MYSISGITPTLKSIQLYSSIFVTPSPINIHKKTVPLLQLLVLFYFTFDLYNSFVFFFNF